MCIVDENACRRRSCIGSLRGKRVCRLNNLSVAKACNAIFVIAQKLAVVDASLSTSLCSRSPVVGVSSIIVEIFHIRSQFIISTRGQFVYCIQA